MICLRGSQGVPTAFGFCLTFVPEQEGAQHPKGSMQTAWVVTGFFMPEKVLADHVGSDGLEMAEHLGIAGFQEAPQLLLVEGQGIG